MTSANEVKEILHKNMMARIDSGKRRAFDVLNIIDACILNAVNECNLFTEVHILRLTTFNNEEEKQSYIHTLKTELKESGYNVAYSPASGVMKITWGY